MEQKIFDILSSINLLEATGANITIDLKPLNDNEKKYNWPLHEIGRAENTGMFLDYLRSIGKTFEIWEKEYIQNNINNVVQFLQKIESKGIKVYVMAWEDIYFPQVKANTYLNSKLIKFNYKNAEYETIKQMMQANRELEIKYDVDNFIETPKDHHPSMLCHQVMAENVINIIESRG
jgi:hypothetical protein